MSRLVLTRRGRIVRDLGLVILAVVCFAGLGWGFGVQL